MPCPYLSQYCILGSIFMDAKSTAVFYFVKYTCKNFAGSVLVKVRHTKQEKLPLEPKAIMVSSLLGILLVPERMTEERNYKNSRNTNYL